MKTIKHLLLLTICFATTSTFAQEVVNNGNTYQVKKSKILLDGEDVSTTLTDEQKVDIFEQAASIRLEIEAKEQQAKELKAAEKEEKKVIKAEKNREKELKKVKKEQKKAEKDRKKVEKDLKRKEKEEKRLKSAKKSLSKAQSKYESENKKFEKLKRKGKLSPEDYEKWEKKFEKLRRNITKSEKRLSKL